MKSPKKYALITVASKAGVEILAEALEQQGIEILSTGGTEKHLRENDINVTSINDYTGMEDLYDGMIKVLNQNVFGALMHHRNNNEHQKEREEYGFDDISFVVCDPYHFQEDPSVGRIDIGGPSILRAAAKVLAFDLSADGPIPICDPNDYEWIAQRIDRGETIEPDEKRRLITKVFRLTGENDVATADWIESFID